jgi:glutamate carboxypeptidase
MNYRRQITVVACIGWLAMTNAAHALDSVENQLVEIVDREAGPAIEFLEETVNINSGTLNPEGVRKLAKLYAREFEAIGFAARVVEQPAEMGRGPHLVAEHEGDQGKHVLLIGHIDTVFEVDSPFQKMRVEDGKAYGPGVEDMKGGNAVILFALKALQEIGALENVGITVVFTGDEESAGRPLETARRDLIAAGKKADIALGFEAGVKNFRMATIARRGASGWRLEVEGRRAHSSQIFQEGYGAGAIYETSRILSSFYEQLAGEQYLTFNPGVIVGGTQANFDEATSGGEAFGKNNVIAQTTVVVGDLRFLTEAQKTSARERMGKIVAQSLPQTQARISFTDGYPAMEPTPGNHALMQEMGKVSQDLGMGKVEPLDPSERGAADISFVAADVEASLAGMGPVGWGGHTMDEGIELSTMAATTKRAALLIYRLTR